MLGTTLDQSVKRYADTIQAPDLSADELKLAGINDFDAMCVTCHGAPGKEREPLGKGLNPQAPDLAESAEHMTPAELFWVTKHGIKMTGMPAWGETHSDDALWPVVALMTELPNLDEQGYQDLLRRAEGQGHHGSDSHAQDEQPNEA